MPPVVAAVVGIVWLQHAAARRELLSSIRTEMGLLAQRAAGNIDELLAQRARDIETLAETPLIADYYRNVDFQLADEAESYRGELERFFGRFARRSEGYAQILYLDRSGRAVCRVGRLAAPAGGADLVAAAGRAPPGGFWASPARELAGKDAIVFAKAIRDEIGGLKGALVLVYDLSHVRALLRGSAVGRTGRAYARMEGGSILGERLPENPRGELLAATSAMIVRPWTVVVEAPRDDFLGRLRFVTRVALATSLIGMLVLLAILLFLVRSITRPLAELSAAARRIGEGDLGTRIGRISDDEIGTLSGAFNEMAENLEDTRRATARLQSQLIQAEKLSAVGQLISSVVHELNNPLAAISGYVQIALMDALPARLRKDMRDVYANVLRCRKVVENLLFFVRQNRRERRRVDLNGAVEAALELLEYRLVKSEDIRVVKDLADEPPAVAGDFQQIVQILVNLISNACDAMQGVVRWPQGKLLTVRTACGGGRARIEIEDNGGGIPLEAQARLFQPFFTTKDAGRGTGLGLSICRQIARDHGGDVSFSSEIGRGAVFYLELPAGRPEDFDETEGSSAPTALPAAPGKRILVADDEKDIAEMIARLMREDGDAVTVAARGSDAIQLLLQEDFDLVISDMALEDAKGQDLYEVLAAKGASHAARILFVTGDVLNREVLEFFSRTKCAYLPKPFDVEELRQAARRLLAGTRESAAK